MNLSPPRPPRTSLLETEGGAVSEGKAAGVVVSDVDAKLIGLYALMAAHTAPECARCRCPHSCCEAQHCETTISWARTRWGVELERTNGVDTRGQPLPLMGPNGCTAAPHLRPVCSVHTCDISGLGFKKGDAAWTKRYFELREEIEELDYYELPS